MPREDRRITFEDVRILFRNFEGRKGLYNDKGERGFSIVLTPEMAEQLERDGWNVKRKAPRSDEEDELIHLPIKVNFDGAIKPHINLISSRGRTSLTEDLCEMVDYADIKTVDVMVNPYDWEVNGNSGRKAYLSSIFVTINETELDLKYADVPDVKTASDIND